MIQFDSIQYRNSMKQESGETSTVNSPSKTIPTLIITAGRNKRNSKRLRRQYSEKSNLSMTSDEKTPKMEKGSARGGQSRTKGSIHYDTNAAIGGVGISTCRTGESTALGELSYVHRTAECRVPGVSSQSTSRRRRQGSGHCFGSGAFARRRELQFLRLETKNELLSNKLKLKRKRCKITLKLKRKKISIYRSGPRALIPPSDFPKAQ